MSLIKQSLEIQIEIVIVNHCGSESERECQTQCVELQLEIFNKFKIIILTSSLV